MTEIINWITGLPDPIVWLILSASAFVEYIFPPFPGDAVVFGGGVLVGSQGINLIPVFLAITTGGVLGAWLDFEIGVWLARPRQTRLHRWLLRPKVRSTVERITKGIARHGDIYLVINRFMPGIRAFFFIGAGYAGYPRGRALVFATIAAVLWNALIVTVGLSVGANLDAILNVLATYTQFAWAAVGFVAMLLLIRLWWRRHKGRQNESVP